jgi:hypothetical protein
MSKRNEFPPVENQNLMFTPDHEKLVIELDNTPIPKQGVKTVSQPVFFSYALTAPFSCIIL